VLHGLFSSAQSLLLNDGIRNDTCRIFCGGGELGSVDFATSNLSELWLRNCILPSKTCVVVDVVSTQVLPQAAAACEATATDDGGEDAEDSADDIEDEERRCKWRGRWGCRASLAPSMSTAETGIFKEW